MVMLCAAQPPGSTRLWLRACFAQNSGFMCVAMEPQNGCCIEALPPSLVCPRPRISRNTLPRTPWAACNLLPGLPGLTGMSTVGLEFMIGNTRNSVEILPPWRSCQVDDHKSAPGPLQFLRLSRRHKTYPSWVSRIHELVFVDLENLHESKQG